MSRKKIIYPVFFECCEYSDDVFWKTIFEDLACGISPCHTYFCNNCLYSNIKNKQFCYNLDFTKGAKVLFDEISEIFITNLELISTQDRIRSFNREKNSNGEPIDWIQIKKKTTKELLIEKFALQKKAHGESIANIRKFLTVIFIGLMLKTIQFSDIQYVDGEICNIQNLNSEIQKSKNSVCSIIFLEKKTISECWKKIITVQNKKKHKLKLLEKNLIND